MENISLVRNLIKIFLGTKILKIGQKMAGKWLVERCVQPFMSNCQNTALFGTI